MRICAAGGDPPAHRELGVNLAGVEIILNMREKMGAMQRQIEEFVPASTSSFPISRLFPSRKKQLADPGGKSHANTGQKITLAEGLARFPSSLPLCSRDAGESGFSRQGVSMLGAERGSPGAARLPHRGVARFDNFPPSSECLPDCAKPVAP